MKRLQKFFPLRPALLCAFLLCCFPGPGLADSLEIPGTGACEVLLRAVAEAFNQQHPGRQVTVPPSVATVGALRLVTSDQAVLVRVARPLTGEEKGQGLTYLPFARDMVIFALGAKVPLRSITTPQLVEVYRGKFATWQDLGGPPVPIRVLLRQPGDSSLRVLQKHLPPFREITFAPAGKVLYTDPDMLAALQKYGFAIGFLTFSSLKGAKTPLYPLALDGIAPTPENVQAHLYNLLEEYSLVFKTSRLNELAKSFLNFLFSRDCQAIMQQYGVLPVVKE